MDLKAIIDTRRKGVPDIPLFLTVFVLIGVGIAMSYSASAVYAIDHFNGDSFYFLKRQLLWFIIGFVALLLFQEIDYRIYLRSTKTLLLLSFLLLILIFIPGIGHSAKGSMRWLGNGTIRIQPSEFVKIFLVIYLAKVFSSEHREGNLILQLLIPMIILAVMFMLILLQPDFGTAVDLLCVAVAVLFVSGFPMFYIVSLFIISIPAFYLIIYQVDYRRERVLAYFDPWGNRYGIGYHIIQSFIAFKKGGLLGVGLGYGTQKIKRLPEPHTDFVFSVIAEEVGLLGTISVIILYCILFWRGIQIAMQATDDFGRLLAVGLTLLLTIQAFINISVVSGVLPTTGIPLPFISYGGSSLLSSMICIGILLNISRYREVVHEGMKIETTHNEVWS